MSMWDANAVPPVDNRWLGLDKRKIWPTLAILALVILWSGIVPTIDRHTPAAGLPAGTSVDLGNGVSFIPDADWTRDGVALPAAPSVTMYSAGTTFTIRAGRFDGTSTELLDQIVDVNRNVEVTGERRSIVVDGVEGAAMETIELKHDGALFAFAADGAGVQVVVEGNPDVIIDQTGDIAVMVSSIRFEGNER